MVRLPRRITENVRPYKWFDCLRISYESLRISYEDYDYLTITLPNFL